MEGWGGCLEGRKVNRSEAYSLQLRDCWVGHECRFSQVRVGQQRGLRRAPYTPRTRGMAETISAGSVAGMGKAGNDAHALAKGMMHASFLQQDVSSKLSKPKLPQILS